MKAAARQALKASGEQKATTMEPQELRTLKHCSVVGYKDGGFAVVSADGQQVLGISTAHSSEGKNPGFEWWLQAINEAVGRQAPRHSILDDDVMRPNPKKYPIEVGPLLTTHWGQMDPYNRKCFYDEVKNERCAVGCVATSMAQVLNYYKTPERGHGTRTVYYPYQDETGQSVTVDFGSVDYRWDLLNVSNFKQESFTDEQADAISTILLHMGVAADMRYGTSDVNGSATTAAAAAEGLRNYLYQPEAQVLYRNSYDDEVWMDMVYSEISTGHPLIYGGQAFSGGHSFILNGYDRNGLVYVNWGWNGDDEGYYNINLLNPGGTSFGDSQDMIVGLNPTVVAPLAAEVTLSAPGTMGSELATTDLADQCLLTVHGPMNDADFKQLREALIQYHVGSLDLSDAAFESLPEKAFYGCHELSSLVLPHGLKHIGDGALADTRYLKQIDLVPADDADFVLDGHIIYNKERNEIIEVLTTVEGELTVDESVTSIHPYAFAGCVLLKSIELPATITKLGAETFYNCFWLEKLKIRSKSVVSLSGYDIFTGIDKSICTLYVPSGLKTTYSRKAQWKDFKDIVEFGTTVKANNAVRQVGQENPTFGYTITGDAITGTPELYTDATIDSPEGVYTIYVTAGSITDPDVEYVNGRLIVEKSATAIDDVTTTAHVADSYDLSGRRIAGRPGKGLSIDRLTDGKVVKRLNK